ncbi:MAG: hypothetical protein FWB78_03395, partial [Treponema sp.]|nr:hypothetical protein [Treponema sp.]
GTFFDPIVGETGIAYTVRLEDEGRTLRVRVTRVGYTGEVVSGSTAPVIRPTLAAETVTISGTPQVGQTLTAVTTLTDVSFHWQVLDGATWRAIPSATGAAYTVESSVNMGMGTGVINIIGRPLRVRVTRTDYLGYLIGGPTAPVSSSP